MSSSLELPTVAIEDFCRQWKVTEFALFGSILTEEFRPDSDVDVLVTFEPDSRWSLRHMVEMKEDLKRIFGREVDLVEKSAIGNPFRRRAILQSHKVLYAA